MKSYIVEYTLEGTDVPSQIFVSAEDETSANDKVIDKFGPYTIINGTYLSKSCGGQGAPIPAVERVNTIQKLIDSAVGLAKEETVVDLIKTEKSLAKPKDLKVKKISNAAKIRDYIRSIVNEGGTHEQAITWAMEHCSMTRSVAGGYVRDQWNRI